MIKKTPINQAIILIIRCLEACLFILFSSMLLLVFIQVVNRYFFGLSLFFTEELTRILLIWTVMIGLPVVMYYRQEICVDLIQIKSTRLKHGMTKLTDLLSIVFCLFLSWYGWLFFLKTSATSLPSLGISRGWVVISITTGALLTIMVIIFRPSVNDSKEKI